MSKVVTINRLHAALDRIITNNPKVATALAVIFEAMTSTDIEDDSEVDAEGTDRAGSDGRKGSDWKIGGGLGSSNKAEEFGRLGVQVTEINGPDALKLADLGVDSIIGVFRSREALGLKVSSCYKRLNINELRAKVKDWGLDATYYSGSGNRVEHADILRFLLSVIDAVVKAISNFGIGQIRESYLEATGKILPVASGHGRAAKVFVKAVLAGRVMNKTQINYKAGEFGSLFVVQG